ncbi:MULTISPECIES: DnaT-like ssDNA-binding protein [unclassified Halomonas]|uniref:DnaT-like ssDNA-binding protein n=1 Tax=unclassified Halomonas TaxID=2609666 RepID=UPI0020769965|nr:MULTISPECIES: DnaT-like ssDNA-binding protein [unclassified Halomonas]
MATYITIADVDAYLGETWAETASKPRYVAMANAWLTAKGVSDAQPIPAEIVTAGCEVAAAAAEGQLYVEHAQGAVTEKRVKAGEVESQKKFADASATFGDNASLPQRLQFALALIQPYVAPKMSIIVGYGAH